MVNEAPSLEETAQEFILCARYGELEDMKAIIDSLKETKPLLRIETGFANLKDANGNTALHMASANGHHGTPPPRHVALFYKDCFYSYLSVFNPRLEDQP